MTDNPFRSFPKLVPEWMQAALAPGNNVRAKDFPPSQLRWSTSLEVTYKLLDEAAWDDLHSRYTEETSKLASKLKKEWSSVHGRGKTALKGMHTCYASCMCLCYLRDRFLSAWRSAGREEADLSIVLQQFDEKTLPTLQQCLQVDLTTLIKHSPLPSASPPAPLLSSLLPDVPINNDLPQVEAQSSRSKSSSQEHLLL